MGHLYHGYVSHNQRVYPKWGLHPFFPAAYHDLSYLSPAGSATATGINLQFWAFKHHQTRHWWCWDGKNSAFRHFTTLRHCSDQKNNIGSTNKTNTKPVSWIPNQKRIQLGSRLWSSTQEFVNIGKRCGHLGPQKSVAQNCEAFKIVVSPVKMAENLGFAPPFSDATDTMITMTCPTIRIPIWFSIWFRVYPSG